MSTTGIICNPHSDPSRVVKDFSHDRPSRCAATELARPRKGARAIVVGILAAVALSYGEYRAIDWEPAATGAYLIGLSSDFKLVLDSGDGAVPAQGCDPDDK